uniref:Integrin beta n=1 Tax=Oncorhynchus tshawytscha TaxID=74940 RepID=A0AAZ3NQ25_ONCTS
AQGLWWSVGERCDLAVTLARRGCGLEFIEHPEVMVEVNPMTSRTQVSPGEITLTLRPGAEASVVVAVQQLERYPVDLYYLVDVSASMQDNLDQLKKVGVALSTRMREHSSDLRLGFGSFVDKNVSPYINVHPSKINNPCSDYEVKCLPAHGFHHVLSMTSNMSEFTRIIKRQRISGNMDTPEGGLDAMLQATVCQVGVGWRGEAKRLLLLMTDQPSHLALDSRLAGIVTPHDGLCHLENSVYMKSSTMDHPSLGLLAEKLLENHIYSLFAVEHLQYQWYEVISNTHTHTYTTLTIINMQVYFNITIGLLSCPDDDDEDDVVQVFVRPVGYNESVVIKVRSRCRCRRCHDDATHQSSCGEDTPDTDHNNQGASEVDCSGRGVCVCERCVCERNSLGTVYGTYCQMDDYSCPYQREILCGGRGVCVSGECVCEEGWTGESCGCPVSTATCLLNNGLLCSGRGRCVCGRCVCDDHQHSGEFCERCPTCHSSCQSHWRCIDCHLSHGLSQRKMGHCNHTCPPLVVYVNDVTGTMGSGVTHESLTHKCHDSPKKI